MGATRRQQSRSLRVTVAGPICYGSLAIPARRVMANGLVWTWFATLYALRGNLLAA